MKEVGVKLARSTNDFSTPAENLRKLDFDIECDTECGWYMVPYTKKRKLEKKTLETKNKKQ